MSDSKKLYFPALDGLRFFAFLLVFLHHVTFYISDSANFFWQFFNKNGWIGVDIFFVLTGFLVTILLLEERAKFGKFSIKEFLKRRAFRIFPLYFLAILVGFFIVPFIFEGWFGINYLPNNFSNQLQRNLPWYLVFLGNWNSAIFGYGDLRAISQLWAISLDLQFYLLWPLALLFLKSFRSSLIFGVVVILVAILTRAYLISSGVNHPGIYTNTFARLDTFAIGVLLAQILFYKPNILEKLNKFYSSFFQILLLVSTVIFLYLTTAENRLAIRHGIFGYLVISLISSYFILVCIKTNSFLVKVFNLKVFKFLGKISFGLYVWHILSLEMVYYLFKINNSILVPIIAFPILILLAYLSYNFFEKPFSILKNKD